MNEITELQQRRAVNQIWNAACSYAFQPDFKAYDREGRAEVYWNCIIGAVRRHYDYPQLEKVFASFSGEEDADVYEGLLWLGLENCVYRRELPDRPVLKSLREDYARRFLAVFPGQPDDYQLLDCLSVAHFRRVLGLELRLSRYDLALLNRLEFSPELDTEALVREAEELFLQWFQIRTEERKREKQSFSFSLRRKSGTRSTRYRRFGIGLADHPEGLYRGGSSQGQDQQLLPTTLSARELREFIEFKYGRSLCSPQETVELERRLCTGNHANCHLHLTRGEPAAGKVQNAFEALRKEQEAAQILRNRQYYRDRLAENRAAEQKLAGAIQNSVLLHLRPAPVRSNTGAILGGRVWRALYLNDEKVFEREEQGNMGDLCVDILLDASTSQKNRQEIVSSQACMIAEALNRCSIPCRVLGFCSMTGYTILRIYRDYNEPRRNDRIFDYVSNGCNRDGLAVRAAHELISRAPWEHKLLVILSDVKPNDIVRVPTSGEEESLPYEQDTGLRDTAYEVRRARADGISVICVFTGDEEDLPSAKLVYGRDFARIRSLDKLADTVGRLIQNQIRNL